MSGRAAAPTLSDLSHRLGAFMVDRHPFAMSQVVEALEAVCVGRALRSADDIEALRVPFRDALAARFGALADRSADFPDASPRVAARQRVDQALVSLIEDCDGCLRRAVLRASLTADERREILRGMHLTRAVDNQLKAFFNASDVRFKDVAFQGKGFRSRGQEAIYAAALRLKRGPAHRTADGLWLGDVVAPVIRDLGVALAMRPGPETIRMALNAQMAKEGPPSDGKDLTIGDFSWGIFPPAAPIATATLAVSGMALAFWREGSSRLVVSFIGEGGSSLGEWHEAINLCAARRLPAIFCIENNQTALSTPVNEQSAVRSFADKAVGYGIPGVTIDGNDADEIAAAFAWGAERARAGHGPTLIELVTMRMCGHAHHDDMLYLGRDQPAGWSTPTATAQGYVDAELYQYWAARDPLEIYATRLIAEGIIGADAPARLRAEAEALVEAEARALRARRWPAAETAGRAVVAGEPARVISEPLDAVMRTAGGDEGLPPLEPGAPFDPTGQTFLEAITRGIADALAADERVFVLGEDVGGRYGNAFMLLRPLLPKYGARLLNTPLAEGAILGASVGAALAGQRPIAEIQFNDFVATGFNQLVNNAAKTRYRWGGSVPMVVRLPFGGMRHAGPYHSQCTEAWFYRTPGLKIVVPSTPEDARALLAAAVADPDPVLFYEHIALYREPRIRQLLSAEAPDPLPLGRAALRRLGDHLAIVSWGAYVHVALRVADRLEADGIHASVLDLRSLAPLDRTSLLRLARHCHRVLVVHEDSRTGSVGESLAAIIQEEAFEWLDAPVRVLGALDTPVPYSPPLEEAFLPSEARVEREARLLAAF